MMGLAHLAAFVAALALPAGSDAVVHQLDIRKASARGFSTRGGYLKSFQRSTHVGTYRTKLDGCKNCVTYYPKITEGSSPDGKRPWLNECYVGRCNFDVPWIAGPEDEACKDGTWKCWYWGLQKDWCDTQLYGNAMKATCKKTCGVCDPSQDQTKYCFSLDPIEWYDSCPAMLWEDAKDVMDTSRICEYNHQIQAVSNPNIWNGKMKAWTAFSIAGHDELGCTAVIQDGAKLYDDKSFVDSMLPEPLPLGSCCDRVHEYFTCLGKKQETLDKDTKGLQFLDQSTYPILAAFSSFCVPLFKYPTKPEFCKAFPTSDPCVEYKECEPCTKHGGIWCNNKQQCNLQKKNNCDTNHDKPSQCASAKKRYVKKKAPPKTTTTPAPTAAAVERKDKYYWQMIHGKNYYASDFFPDPAIGLRTDSAAMFNPYH